MRVFAMTAVLLALAAPAFAGDMPQPMNASDIKWGRYHRLFHPERSSLSFLATRLSKDNPIPFA